MISEALAMHHIPSRRRAFQARTAVRSVLLAAALALMGTGAIAQQSRPPSDAPEDYPDHPGRDATFYFCSACHGFKLVAAQALPRERWDATLTTMSERHGMPKVDGAARREMLDYLEKAFGPRAVAPGRQNPFAPR